MALLKTAVVGHPIAHSLSPLLHNAIYRNEGVDAEMTAIDNEHVEPLVEMMRTVPLGLTAITLPHKQAVMPLLDEIDDTAREIGAVNTVINRDGKLIGYNTDIVGIAAALEGVELRGKNILVIGAGGAAQPLAFFLHKQNIEWKCVSRNVAKTKAACEKFGGNALDAMPEDGVFDIIVNTTPVGLAKSDELPCPENLLQPGVTVFDLIYTPTKLQHVAKQKGVRVITGLSMFVAQGLEQERLWLGRKIPDSGYSALLLDHLRETSKNL